jgi:hypothetical protein
MPHQISYWYSILVAEKDNQPTIAAQLSPTSDTLENLQAELATLNSSSKVSIWRFMFFVVAVAYWLLEKFWDIFKAETQAIADAASYGSNKWWLDAAKDFQYEVDLELLTDASVKKYLGYSSIDVSKQIVKLSSISSLNGTAFLKVANLNGTTIVKLTDDQLAAFKTYVKKKQPAGASVVAISEDADLVKYQITIYYNGLINLSNFKLNIENAINSYHAQLNADLNGVVELPKLTDVIQAVSGYVSIEPIIAFAKSQVGGSEYINFTRVYETYAGYAKIDPAFPLSDTIIYIPN